MTRIVLYRAMTPSGDLCYGIRNESTRTDRQHRSLENLLNALAELVDLHRGSGNSLEIAFGPKEGILLLGGTAPLRYRAFFECQRDAVWQLVLHPQYDTA